MMKKVIYIFSVASLLILPLEVFAQFSTVYVSSGSVNFIENNQGSGTSYKTYRDAPQGYFSASGAAQFLNTSDAQNINGYMKHIPTTSNQAYTFEVGSGSDLRQLSVSGSRPADAVIGAAWIDGDPSSIPDPTSGNALHSVTSVTDPITAVSPLGQWDWVDMGSGQTAAGGVSVSVSIPDMTLFALQPKLRLVGWNGSSWIDLSGSATATGVAENSLLSGTIPVGVVIEAIAIGSIINPLPVKLEAFTATVAESGVQLDWRVVTESVFSHYELEKSIDARHFGKIAEIKGNGNNSRYSFNDVSVSNGTYYYRLRMVDLDGTYAFSQIRSASIQGENAIVVYPNPTADKVEIRGVKPGNIIYVSTTSGRQLYSQPLKGDGVVSINLNKFSSGVYYILVKDEHGAVLSTQRVIKI